VIYVFRTIVHIKLFFTFVLLSSKIIANDYVIFSSLHFFFFFSLLTLNYSDEINYDIRTDISLYVNIFPNIRFFNLL